MQAQVGINTTGPEASLDIVSNSEGILVPRVALSNRDVGMPITSPDNGELVFNTHTTLPAEGLDADEEVTTGFYFWEINKWYRLGDDIKVDRYAFQYDTNGFQLRPDRANGNSVGEWQDLDWDDGGGGISAINFIAPSTGVYQIIFAGNYGLGYAEDAGSHPYDFAVGEGIFRIEVTVNGTFLENVDKAVNSLSLNYNGGSKYYDLPKHTTLIKNINLNAGDTCQLIVMFDEIRLENEDSGAIGNSWVGDDTYSEYNNKIQVQLIGK